VLVRAHELGVTFFNSSNMYGPYLNEELMGISPSLSLRCRAQTPAFAARGAVLQRRLVAAEAIRPVDLRPGTAVEAR
jgi:hypothetical protein